MRSLLAQRDFTGYAGQFVWLALDFDNPNNADFLAKHGTLYTPTFYIVDAARDRARAEQDGAMTVPEVIAFLERGKHGMPAQPSALADGDALVASNRRFGDDEIRARSPPLQQHERLRKRRDGLRVLGTDERTLVGSDGVLAPIARHEGVTVSECSWLCRHSVFPALEKRDDLGHRHRAVLLGERAITSGVDDVERRRVERAVLREEVGVVRIIEVEREPDELSGVPGEVALREQAPHQVAGRSPGRKLPM